MNIANPCKVLVVFGALAFGFGIRADGTLPFPFAEEVQLPLLMGGSAQETLEGQTTRKLDISMSLDTSDEAVVAANVVKACAKPALAAKAFPAAGTVQVGDDLYDIQGLCAPQSATSAQRSVIATTSGRLLQLDGSFKVSSVTKKVNFVGSALTIDTVSTSPESGEESSAVITFTMEQLPLESN